MMDPDQIAKDAMPLVESCEGCILHAYQDDAGVWTIGWGSTRDVAENPITSDTPPITQDQADFLLQRDLGRAVRSVLSQVTVPLTYNEAAALTDFVYNLGAGNLAKSTLLKLLNARNYAGAAQQILQWDEAGGQVLAGLLRRRQAEQQKFLTPDNTTLDTSMC
jgi:lysozyme